METKKSYSSFHKYSITSVLHSDTEPYQYFTLNFPSGFLEAQGFYVGAARKRC